MRQRIVGILKCPEFWLAALLCWLLLSAGRSLGTPWARAALTEALRWSAGIGLALALGLFFRRPKIAARFVVTMGGAAALLGIESGFQQGNGGLTGPYQEHQLYGSVLLLFLPTAAAVALTARDFRWRLASVAAAGIVALCLALSQTRSAWAGALAASLVFVGLWLLRSASLRRHGRTIFATAAALAGAVLVLWMLFTPSDLRAPLARRVGTLSQLNTDKSWQSRLTLWRGAFRLAAAHPLGGIGLGRYPGEQWRWTQAGRPLEPSEHPSLSEEAHNFYLQTAAEVGLVGLGLYGGALTAFACQGLHRLRQPRRRRSPSQDALIISSLSLVAGQSVDAFASPSWQFGEASLLFWGLVGLGLSAMRTEDPDPVPLRAPLVLRRIGRFALAGSVAVTLAANLLPLGLLTPVEAYAPPTGWTYVANSLAISGPTTVTAGQIAAYTLTATYMDAAQQPHQVDVTLDPYPGDLHPTTAAGFNVARTDKTISSSKFGAAGTDNRNKLTGASGDISRPLSISGYFYDSKGQHASPIMSVSITN